MNPRELTRKSINFIQKAFRKSIIFYRVRDWLHILGFILLGYVYSHPQINFWNLTRTLAVGGLYLAHGYSLNDIFDDQLKIKIPYKDALFFSLLSLVFCLIGSSLISLKVLYIVVFGHICGMFYSAKPFRFKNRLFLDLIFNSLCFVPLFLLGYIVEKNLSTKILILSSMVFLYFIFIQLIHQIQDYTLDIKHKQSNTVQILGIRKATYLIFFFLLIYIYLSYLFREWRILKIYSSLISSLFALVLAFYLAYKRPTEIKLENGSLKKFKLEARYISIAYGIAMLIVFSLDI